MEQRDFLKEIAESFRIIADSIAGIHEIQKADLDKRFPRKRGPIEAIVTRVPTEDDRLREAQGASDRPIEEWLSEELQEDIGVREREWIERNARSKATG